MKYFNFLIVIFIIYNSIGCVDSVPTKTKIEYDFRETVAKESQDIVKVNSFEIIKSYSATRKFLTASFDSYEVKYKANISLLKDSWMFPRDTDDIYERMFVFWNEEPHPMELSGKRAKIMKAGEYDVIGEFTYVKEEQKYNIWGNLHWKIK